MKYRLLKFLVLTPLILIAITLQSVNAWAATDVTGTWNFIFSDGVGATYANETVKLIQVDVTTVGGIGTIAGGPSTVYLSGTNIDEQVDFITILDNGTLPIEFQGVIETPDLMTGSWQDNNAANSGIWIGTRLAVVTPKTKLTDPPVVTVEETKVTLNFIPFSGAGALGTKSGLQTRAKVKPPKLNFKYAAELDRIQDGTGKNVKGERRRIVSKKNQVTLNSIKPGVYTARYRVEFTKKGSDEIVSKTGFSPRVTFTVP